MELKGNIRVFCRVRGHQTESIVSMKEPTALKLHLGDAEKTYFMDEVFTPSASQEEVSICYFSCQFRKEV